MNNAEPNPSAPPAAVMPPADPRIKQKGQSKTARIPIKIVPVGVAPGPVCS